MADQSVAQFIDFRAAAQIIAPGAIIVDDFQKEITDALRRSSVLEGRIEYVPATGDFSTYYEQNTINGGEFVDPRVVSAAASSNPRTPHSLKMKAITNEVVFGHYDLTLGQQQNNFPELKAKDLNDMINGVGLTHGRALWRGNDTSLSVPTTMQYRGLSKQITNTFSVSSTASIVDAIRAKVAAMTSSELYVLMPTAIYIHPIAHHYLEQEEKNSSNNETQINSLTKTMVAGVTVLAIMTSAGVLPLIPEPFMTFAVNGTDPLMTDYGIAILTEPMIEYHYVGKKDAFLFQLGTTSDIQEKYIAIKYGAPVAKGPSYAHAYGTITRPTIAAIA
ncbi:hypothetical protein [Paenibacillus graminis]|uniref:Phage capsid protein n=1 Tax=Paenibacillus graminis TaxID=189425 RepID=A0A089M985_9BACL|nr:hypothetical protein [Paenibacillus graminis]AIQ70366.1 hypothetical protein PGRAT_24085 [Paenibacillus graminis]MEC0169728.1 hypothetical protein [Paenibacillus graminis]